MTNTTNITPIESDLFDATITVETVEFPFEMSPPEFSEIYNSVEGLTLNLSDIVSHEHDSLILKGQEEEAINVITSVSLEDSGIVAANNSDIGTELQGYHYYSFSDESTLYSEYAINLIFI